MDERTPTRHAHDRSGSSAEYGTFDLEALEEDDRRFAVFYREETRERSRRASLPRDERERFHAKRIDWFARCDADDPNMTLLADENDEHEQVGRLAEKYARARAERVMARPALCCHPLARRTGRRAPRRTLRRRVRRTSRARDGDGGDGESDGPRPPHNLIPRDAASVGGAP